jgi:GNAT superfamily N-acetyltransferase
VSASPVRVEHATEAQLEPLLAAYEWLFAPPGSIPPDWDRDRARGVIAEAIAAERAAVLVAVEEQGAGSLVGFCTAYLDLHSVRFGLRCWVEDLAVDPGRRSRGIGAMLLSSARKWAAEAGATHLELDSGRERRDAHRFYERERPSWSSLSYAWRLDR